MEIVAPFYSTFVFDGKGRQLGKGTATEGRVYAPGVVADLDRDGAKEIVYGWSQGIVGTSKLTAVKVTPTGVQTRSLTLGGSTDAPPAARDLDGDGLPRVSRAN